MTEDRPKVGVGVVVIHNQTILLGRRKGSIGADTWSLAGGHLEFGEDVIECAKRELAEETGLKAVSLREGPWVNDMIDGKHYVTLFVMVDAFEGEVQLLEPHKCKGWAWFEPEAIPTPLFPPVASLIHKVGLHEIFAREFIS